MLLTPQSELAKVLGEILSKTSGTSYWENPFQVSEQYLDAFYNIWN